MSYQSKVFVIQAACLILALCSSSYALPRSNNLHTLKKIYILGSKDFEQNVKSASEYEQMRADLRQELESFGFTVVDEASSADATLSGDLAEIVVVDGPQPDPPKFSFAFRLTSAKGELVWKTKFEIGSRAPRVEINQKAAKKIADRLFNDWRASAKRAGLLVKDKIASTTMPNKRLQRTRLSVS